MSITPPPTITPDTISTLDARKMMRELDAQLYRELRAAVRASGLIFDWCVTEASYDLEPRIVKAQFGDGYAQRRADGINTQAHKWNLAIKNATAQTASEVVNFFSARNGVEVFNWTPPRTAVPEDVICPSWALAYGDLLETGARLYTVSFKFEEVYI